MFNFSDSPSVVSTRVEQIGETSVVVRWETESTRILIARYDIEIRDTTIADRKISTKIYKTASNPEFRQYTVKDLKPGTLYQYRVRAVFRRNGGQGTWSNIQSFTTKTIGILIKKIFEKVLPYGYFNFI